jgi:hypothetical protein
MNTQSQVDLQVESRAELPVDSQTNLQIESHVENKTSNENQEQKVKAILGDFIAKITRERQFDDFIKTNEYKPYAIECFNECFSKIVTNNEDKEIIKMRDDILSTIGVMKVYNKNDSVYVDEACFISVFMSPDISPKTALDLKVDEVIRVKKHILESLKNDYRQYSLTVIGCPEFVLQIKNRVSLKDFSLIFCPKHNETESKSEFKIKSKLEVGVREILNNKRRASKCIPIAKQYLQSEEFKNSFEMIMTEYITLILNYDNEYNKDTLTAISELMKYPKNKTFVRVKLDFFKNTIISFLQIPEFLNKFNDEAISDFQSDAVNELISSLNFGTCNNNPKMVVVNLSDEITFKTYFENYKATETYVKLCFQNCEETSS